MNEDPAIIETEPLHTQRAREGDEALGRALALVRFLRERCPWDAKQTPDTLRPYLLEEAHEVADAIRSGDDEGLAGELGDLLLNIAFQIVLGEERGAFDAGGVTETLEAKMEARHPHVYGDADAPPDWEALKAAERRARGAAREDAAGDPENDAGDRAGDGTSDGTIPDPFAGVSHGLDPLSRAARVQERMAALGFDWPDLAGPLEKVREEAAELERAARAADDAPRATDDAPRGARPGDTPAPPRIGDAGPAVVEEVGDLLFAVVNASRLAGAHPANALLGAIEKFERRCRRMIEVAEGRGIAWGAADLETLDAVWDEVKGEE
ncbi:MazG nucleotide pyrophosphohydrolase domain-containing protein [Candidatus Palauibacter sp.]|uniref:MazG nucleotide pyrophosphohydrolase domain-containing protein n=1 Tax=Candidatus Palauibacter sp. TaxID=3101350 RepID=UPI003B013177